MLSSIFRVSRIVTSPATDPSSSFSVNPAPEAERFLDQLFSFLVVDCVDDDVISTDVVSRLLAASQFTVSPTVDIPLLRVCKT